eukprot:366571-Chlamydomonas_euryale.AAC.31
MGCAVPMQGALVPLPVARAWHGRPNPESSPLGSDDIKLRHLDGSGVLRHTFIASMLTQMMATGESLSARPRVDRCSVRVHGTRHCHAVTVPALPARLAEVQDRLQVPDKLPVIWPRMLTADLKTHPAFGRIHSLTIELMA